MDSSPNESLSVVMTAYNEGDEVRSTLTSIKQSTRLALKIHLVDDGSTDGCCTELEEFGIDLIRHKSRIGIAASRLEATDRSRGAVIAIMDAHQRLDDICLDRCTELAMRRKSIVVPDLRAFEEETVFHGALFSFDRRKSVFAAQWNRIEPPSAISTVSSLRAPLYLIPREVYPKVCWSRALRGWGGSEACVSLKAFFAGVDLLHLCGPVAWHKLKSKFHYPVDWPEVWRNHAIIARICFDERTWYEYWLPDVFDVKLTEPAKADLESDLVVDEHRQFQKIKVRRDIDFWKRLVFRDVPAAIKARV